MLVIGGIVYGVGKIVQRKSVVKLQGRVVIGVADDRLQYLRRSVRLDVGRDKGLSRGVRHLALNAERGEERVIVALTEVAWILRAGVAVDQPRSSGGECESTQTLVPGENDVRHGDRAVFPFSVLLPPMKCFS